ncbi:core histone macro-H2A.1-like [Symsagittifera roscoffensis]|uniref:core histone macro-H2A.1-like n=1 Tax=Symsagittifera roscoffensis TaxID=84072 RepID=UPI00307C9948
MSGRAPGAIKKVKAKPISRSQRAGVLFPVSRFRRYLKDLLKKFRIGVGASVYLAAVIEYLTAEVLELAGNASRDNKRKRVIPRHILLAIANDEELHELLKHVTIPQAGVLPRIHPELLQKKKGSSSSSKPAADTSSAKINGVASASKSGPKTAASKQKAAEKVYDIANVDKAAPKSPGPKTPTGAAKADKLSVVFTKKCFNGQDVEICLGNIAKITSDAIVNPTNAKLKLVGDIGTTLQKATGKLLEDDLNDLYDQTGELQMMSAIITPSHGLPCKNIIHCNPPEGTEKNAETSLVNAIKNCLKLADNNNCSSIALPPIIDSSVAPKIKLPEVTLRAINQYFTAQNGSKIKKLEMVFRNLTVAKQFAAVLQQM